MSGRRVPLPALIASVLAAGLLWQVALAAPFGKRRSAERSPDTTGHPSTPGWREFHRDFRGDRGLYQGAGRTTGGAIKLLRAAELRQEQTGSGEVIYLERNVKIIQDSLTIWCDNARHYRSQGELILTGQVVMMDARQRLAADEVTYFTREKVTHARGNVGIVRDSLVLLSRVGEFDQGRDLVTFRQSVHMEDLKRSVILTGEEGTYNTESRSGEVPAQPVLIRYDSTGAEEARIESGYMRYDAEAGAALARDDVVVNWHEVDGYCDELYFWPDRKQALMVGSPRVMRHRDEAVGDSIWLYVTGDALDSAVVVGHARSYTPSDSSEGAPRSTLTGERIVMDFEDGKIRRLQSDGQAVGVYHIFDEGEDQGSNKVSGDRVVLWMAESQLKDVVVVGGTEGQFLPPHKAAKVRRDE